MASHVLTNAGFENRHPSVGGTAQQKSAFAGGISNKVRPSQTP
jgi:hypothetical protein